MRIKTKQFRTGLLSVALLAATPAIADENVMVVFDGSNSMWGQIDGTAKIEIARDVMENLLGGWVDERKVGLMAYGHRRRGDCSDIEMLVEPGEQSRASILDRIGKITPTGKTPLTDAVEQAAQALSYTDQPATVVLISDGLESCERDACALAESLEKSGVGFTAHVVGFGLTSDEDASSLSCIAERTGGKYITAGNADELGSALSTVGQAVAEALPEPKPEPAPEPAAPQVVVNAPDTAMGGSAINVTWAPKLEGRAYINVVPVGTDPGEFGSYVLAVKKTEIDVLVPSTEGLYEVRYMDNKTKETLGFDTIEVTTPEVALSAEDTVATGAKFDVSWTPTIYQGDYVAIVPAGADEGEFGNYQSVRSNTEFKLNAPADPGLYELRYILKVDNSTAGTRPIEVTNPEVALQVPSSTLTGAAFDVSWSSAVNQQDYITIVPVGTDEGQYGNYIVVRDDSKGALKAPAEPGMYEVRYILREGTKTLAREMIEVAPPEVTVAGPETVATGAKFETSWTGTVNKQDYVTIVPMGTEEGKYGNYLVVRDDLKGALDAPSEPGMYELRYVLREGAKTLATATIEVTEPEVSVTAPETALAGSKFDVSWSNAVNPKDYITIVAVGTEEGKYGNYITVRNDTSSKLQAPAETGLYEVRYVLREGAKTITSTMLEVTEPEVTISTVDEVRAGEKIKVSWTGTVSTSDYVTIVPMGVADDKYGNYKQVRNDSENDLNVPDETGLYEVRYVLREGRRVLARQMVEVVAADATLDTGGSITA
ncbi:MAG: VWA domain-containing protein, partial [Pseudomonadota bacterium]